MQTGITGSLGPVPLGSALAFTHDAPNHHMGIGGVANGVAFVLPGTNDYLVYFDEAPATPVPLIVVYRTVGDAAGTRTSTSFTITLAPTAAPEPASILLLAGAVGALRWGRRRGTRLG